MRRIALASVLALLVVSCQNLGELPTDLQDPSFVINDGARGGNPDFFWLPPLVRHPLPNAPNWDFGEFNNKLEPEVHICAVGNLLAEGRAGCASQQPEGFPLVYTRDSGPDRARVHAVIIHYILLWRTRLYDLDNETTYRIVAIVGNTELGYADIDIVGNRREFKNVNTDEFIPLKDDRTLPIRFRIENGALCDPEATNCVSKTINLSEGGTVALANGNNVQVPPQESNETPVTTITVQPCTEFTELPIDLPLFGDCMDITADPPVSELLQPAIISICSLDPNFDLPGTQEQLVTLHRFADGDVFALPHRVDNCAAVIGSRLPEENALERLARAGLGALRGALGMPTPLDARTALRRRLDRGRGGASPFFSSFQYALPAKMDKLDGTDDQSAPVGENVEVPPGVLVTDLDGAPVANATVTFEVTAGNGAIGSTLVPVLSNADGIASVNFWTLGPNPGANTVEARGVGIAVPGNDGPRVEFFDPFIPIKLLNPDDEVLVQLQTGALDFNATGTSPVVVIDGVLSPGEWDNAQQFQTGTETGSISNATVYIQNDGTNLYLAVAVPDATVMPTDQIVFRFDNANNQTSDDGDDQLNESRSLGFRDAHFEGAVPSWGVLDSQQDGTGASGQSGATAIYEIAHPLNGGDADDFALSVNDQVGFCVRYFDDNASVGTGYPLGCVLADNDQLLYQVITILP